MNPLKMLQTEGQSVWLDFIRRNLLGAALDTLIREDGLRGITSNPAIFEAAIGHSDDYDEQLAELLRAGDLGAAALCEEFAIRDVQIAADQLRPVYDATRKRDGYVSLEVSPHLANDTDGTVAEARRLWRRVERPNLMIKVPGTRAGVPAIEQLISQGINVNVTLLFALDRYVDVANAYLIGLETYARDHHDISHVASVASFFISRIDSAVDALIDASLERRPGDRLLLEGLKGKVAIANAKLAYRHYEELYDSPRWTALARRAAQTQRLLWASTSTKNPAYPDVRYVETLIGKDTVSTIPPATMDAFRDHGRVAATLAADVDAARKVMDDLATCGISIEEVTDKLTSDAVRLFADANDNLLAAVAIKRQRHIDKQHNHMMAALPEAIQMKVDAEIEAWRIDGRGRRLWAKDASLWTSQDEGEWLGWLHSAEGQLQEVPSYRKLSAEAAKFDHVLLLGMGGSSLGPEVLAETFGEQRGQPALHVLDSTDPAQIGAFESRLDPLNTLYIISSKSGGTLEPNILKQYFFERTVQAVGRERAGSRFIAVTDSGSKMQHVAEEDHFARLYFGDPTIGGRYSVLSPFGLVPAAAAGIDVERLLRSALLMVRSCGPDVPPEVNPGIVLGVILGTANRLGRDKLTILSGPGLDDFGAWAEQLIAESTGKEGRGIIPVDAEPLGAPGVYGCDRLFVHLWLGNRPDPQAPKVAALEQAGHPVVRIVVGDEYQLGQEFFRWEVATAVAGAMLGIHPFNQPDVEASKIATRKLTDAYERNGSLPSESPILKDGPVLLFADPANAGFLREAATAPTLEAWLAAHFARLSPGDYAAFLAYLPRNRSTNAALLDIRLAVRDARRVATCVGFGPRFLHSTGQAYKGGPNTGVFLQITCDDRDQRDVPKQKYTFGVVKAAQARGDFDVLATRGRRALRVHLGPDLESGLDRLIAAIRVAVAQERSRAEENLTASGLG